MSILGDLSGSTSSGGSINNSMSVSNSFTNGTAATQSSNQQAAAANATAYNYWKEAAEYNAEQARIQREWQEKMANTTYQRTIEDMKKAGINPILAAQMGLGTASVGSGSTASMTSPSVFMGNSFADTNSSSNAYSEGKSWQESESGLATGLQLMGDAIAGAIKSLNTGATINNIMSDLGGKAKTTWNDIKQLMIDNLPESVAVSLGLKGKPSHSGGGHKF